MEEYVGKICPLCKTKIEEDDAVTVCPECGTPHHAACWEVNNGCSKGCSDRKGKGHVESQSNASDESETAPDETQDYSYVYEEPDEEPGLLDAAPDILKILAVIIIIVGVIASFVVGFKLFGKQTFALGLGVMVGGSFSAVLVGMLIAGFAKLVENSTETRDTVRTINRRLQNGGNGASAAKSKNRNTRKNRR